MSTPHDTITTVTDADIARMFAGYEGHIDEVFVMTVTDASEAHPVTDADVMLPYDVGWRDAEKGWPCHAMRHYAKLGDIQQYELGWGDCMNALECAAEYQDYFDDEQFKRWGC